MPKTPIITGIVCTHNREGFLERCIKSLFNQTLDSSKYEVLIVDNGSTDRTRDVCEAYSVRPNFKYVYEPVLGLSKARNCGWKHANGKYVGYIDDDARADRTWFQMALWSFENITPIPEWVGGPIELEWEAPPPVWIKDEYRTTLGEIHWGNNKRFLNDSGERLGGGNSFYLRSTLAKMNGFDTRLGRKRDILLSGEETQFQHRLRERGGRMFYHPGIRIYHHVGLERLKPQFFYKRYFWGGVTDHIINQTLIDVNFEPISQAADDRSKIIRLLQNCRKGLGFWLPDHMKIQGRIYLSYVLGSIFAAIKYNRQTLSRRRT